MQRGMIFDPDHMSVKGRDAALNLVEARGLPRGDLLAQLEHAGGAAADLQARRDRHPLRRRLRGLRRQVGATPRHAYRGRQYFGIGYGADQNGFGGQGGPRGADVPNPVTYPFKSFDGKQTIYKQRSGQPRLRHQRRRRRPLRPLPGLDRGPAEARRRRDHQATWAAAPRPTCRCGSGPRASPACAARSGGAASTARAWATTLRIDEQRRSRRCTAPASRSSATASWQWCTRFKKTSKRELGKKRRVAGVFDTSGNAADDRSARSPVTGGGIGRGDRRRAQGPDAEPGRGHLRREGQRAATLFVYRTRGKKVRYVGVASAAITGSDRQLRNYVLRAHLQ